MATCNLEVFGADPANIKWNVVRGDTSEILVEFFEADEETVYDINNWIFSATAYNPRNGITDDLEITVEGSSVKITAPADITEFWGTGVRGRVAELSFDLQAEINGKVWTPIVGTISVIGDVSGAIL